MKKIIHNKIQAFILEYQWPCLEAGFNLVYLGRNEGQVDFGLTKPYLDPESLTSLKVVSMRSIEPKDLGAGKIGNLLEWFEDNHIDFFAKVK